LNIVNRLIIEGINVLKRYCGSEISFRLKSAAINVSKLINTKDTKKFIT